MCESLIFAHVLFFLVSDVRESLISRKSNEQFERIAHFASPKLSNHERFAQVTQRK